MDGRLHETLWWTYEDEDGGTSASPAHEVAFGGIDEERATSTLLKRLWEGLELPGEPSDYHFAIQTVANALWRRRRTEPEVLQWVEWLEWLDIRLVKAYPDAVRDEYADEWGRSQFYGVGAFHTLIELYSREGFLQDALGVARIAGEFEQGEGEIAELEERLAALQAEDGN
jgi:hypothetical protein